MTGKQHLVMAWALLLTCHARAADQTLLGQRLDVAPDGTGFTRTVSGKVLKHLHVDASITGIYERNPVRFSPAYPWQTRPAALVGQRAGSELTWAVGLKDWVQLFGALPVTAYQDAGRGAFAVSTQPYNRTAFGDARLGAKLRVLTQAAHGVDAAFVPQVTVPLGVGFSALVMDGVRPALDLGWRGWAGGFTSDGLPTLVPALAVSRTQWGTTVALNSGVRLRRPHQVEGFTVGQELLLRGGIGFKAKDLADKAPWLRYVPLEVSAEGALHANVSHPYVTIPYVTPQAPLDRLTVVNPPLLQKGSVGAELAATVGLDLFGVRPFLGGSVAVVPGVGTPDWRVAGGVRWTLDVPAVVPALAPVVVTDRDGDGVLDTEDLCPDEGGVTFFRGCPIGWAAPVLDSDQDDLPNNKDACFDQAEDKDGFEDEDGCPEPDNDQDTILDGDDSCPNEPETVNGVLDGDGCPDDDEEPPAPDAEPETTTPEIPPTQDGDVIVAP